MAWSRPVANPFNQSTSSAPPPPNAAVRDDTAGDVDGSAPFARAWMPSSAIAATQMPAT